MLCWLSHLNVTYPTKLGDESLATLRVSKLYWYTGRGVEKHGPYVDIPMLGQVLDTFMAFDGTFISGKAYGLFGHIGDGAIGVSYALAGRIPFGRGTVSIDDRQCSTDDLSSFSKVAWFEKPTRRWSRRKTVREQIEVALRTGSNQYGVSGIEELKELFMLSEGRLDRPLSQYSHERWRASLAIGLAEGKRVFTIPWMNPAYASAYLDLWIRRSVEVLKSYDCWVFIPTTDPNSFGSALDEVIVVKGSFAGWQESEL